jgi:hypothetical protein
VRDRAWLFTGAAVAALAAAAVIVRGINHDAAWYVHMVGVMIDGGTSYVDAVDTNPPLILLLTWPPVWMARLVHAAPISAFNAYVFVLALLCSVWCAGIIRRLWPSAPSATRGVLTVAILFLATAFPKGDFGQREHLAVLATLPFVLIAGLRAQGRDVPAREAVIAGAIGAIGFAIKPHFLLVWIAIAAAVAIAARTWRSLWRPEHVAAAAMLAAYLVVVVIGFPQYFEVARRVWQVYDSLNPPIGQLVGLRELQAAVVALAILLVVRLPRETAAPLWVIAAGAGGFLAASLVQLKGWGYHMLPPQVFLSLFFLAALLAIIQAAPALLTILRGGAKGVAIAIAAALVATSAKYVYEATRGIPNDTVKPLAAIVRQNTSSGPIAMLATRALVYPAFPLVNQTGVAWSLRHHSLWFLREFYEAEAASGAPGPIAPHAPAAMPPLERAFFDEIVSDLCRKPPRLLIVETPAPPVPGGRRSLDLEAYYGQDARFARLFSSYRPVGTVAAFRVFKSDAPSCGGTRP